ncbi:MAG: deaminase domain-containing protein [Pseudomonadota bacterium]
MINTVNTNTQNRVNNANTINDNMKKTPAAVNEAKQQAQNAIKNIGHAQNPEQLGKALDSARKSAEILHFHGEKNEAKQVLRDAFDASPRGNNKLFNDRASEKFNDLFSKGIDYGEFDAKLKGGMDSNNKQRYEIRYSSSSSSSTPQQQNDAYISEVKAKLEYQKSLDKDDPDYSKSKIKKYQKILSRNQLTADMSTDQSTRRETYLSGKTKGRESSNESGDIDYVHGSQNKTHKKYDTEPKMLRAFKEMLREDGLSGYDAKFANGKITAHSRLASCNSCKHVMQVFSEKYPNVSITVTDDLGGKMKLKAGVISDDSKMSTHNEPRFRPTPEHASNYNRAGSSRSAASKFIQDLLNDSTR